MAIQISGCTVIDNSRNITNVNNMCVGVVTMTGSSGNIETPGTITVGNLDYPPTVITFSPTDGATGVARDTNIVLTFDKNVQKATSGVGTTANITLRDSSGIGTALETIPIADARITVSNATVTINPTANLPIGTDVYVVVDTGAFTMVNLGSGNKKIDTYNFTVTTSLLGTAMDGGYLICCTGGVKWIVACSSSEVSRNWYSRNNANTTAQQVSGCTGWFVPTSNQLQNPGFTCRAFWDSYCATSYWSSSEANAERAVEVSMTSGGAYSYGGVFNVYGGQNKTFVRCVRSFRCVTY